MASSYKQRWDVSTKLNLINFLIIVLATPYLTTISIFFRAIKRKNILYYRYDEIYRWNHSTSQCLSFFLSMVLIHFFFFQSQSFLFLSLGLLITLILLSLRCHVSSWNAGNASARAADHYINRLVEQRSSSQIENLPALRIVLKTSSFVSRYR